MNKGVIVQLEYNVAIIMKNDGAFVSYPRNPLWQIGDVVTLSQRHRFPLKAVLISCAVLLLAFVGAGAILYNIPATYIEISVNPSMQITLNRFDRVLSVTGLNANGDEILHGLECKNLTLYEAYSRIFNRLENNGHLRNTMIQLVVANNAQKVLDNIESVLRDASEKYAVVNNMRISIMRYTNDEYLSLTHPLPVKEIPEDTLPNDTPPESNEPSSQPENTPSLPSSNMPHHGRWKNGWWDWNCG